jgi:hypothetical protein
VSTSAPSPPNSFGTDRVRKPRFDASHTIDQSKDLSGSGTRSARSAAGRITSMAKSWAMARSSRWRGVNAKSTMALASSDRV